MNYIQAKDIPPSFFEGRREDAALPVVQDVLGSVRTHGDTALIEYTKRFDSLELSSFAISESDIAQAETKLRHEKYELYEALCISRDFARNFARRQRASFDDFEMEITKGLFAGQKTIPIKTAGVYVPAGRFPLLSSVIMDVIPAQEAGVSDIILCTSPRAHPHIKNAPYADEGILALASLCGIKRVFALGGAQAIAAMAYGTASIPRADVIVGPGNKYVACAKKTVYGEVGIDMIAGPSEVLIIADDSANVQWLASDMIAQAEHDADAQAVLLTSSVALADKVCAEIESQLKTLSTKETAQQSLDSFGYIIIADTKEEIVDIANKKAPEHLELALDEGALRSFFVKELHNYGSLFIGHHAAEVLGDYAAGLNHTLPTSTSARFTGGLSVRHFLKTVTTLRGASAVSANAAAQMARAEGLEGHARAAQNRL